MQAIGHEADAASRPDTIHVERQDDDIGSITRKLERAIYACAIAHSGVAALLELLKDADAVIHDIHYRHPYCALHLDEALIRHRARQVEQQDDEKANR